MANLIDELSILIAPVTDGGIGTPSLFDVDRRTSAPHLKLLFDLEAHRRYRAAALQGSPLAANGMMETMNREKEQRLVERRDRGVIHHASSAYGTSLEGIPLTVYLPDLQSAEIVILASIHGDEAETTVVVSEALRCVPRGDLQAAVILWGNPDGMLRGTRGNGRGVD